jgi:two-component system cell cycle sensor histidine kinase PleC
MSNIITPQTHKNSYALKNDSSATALFATDDIPRMILDEAQNVLFCNDALHDICGPIEGANVSDLFVAKKKLKKGENKVKLKTNKKQICFQVDWVNSPKGQKFMVASTQALSDGVPLKNYVEEKLNPQNDVSSAPFIDLSFDACSITDETGRFITINENFTTLFGYRFTDLDSINIDALIHSSDQEKFKKNLSNLIQNKNNQQVSIETYCLDKEGKTLWVEWRHKKIDGKIYSTGRDLTPLKSYKDSIQHKQEKLDEAEIIGNFGRWEWKVGSENIKLSNQIYKIFGVTPDDFCATFDSINNMIDERDSGRMEQVFQRAIIEQNNYEMDFRITRPDGDIRYIRCEGRCEIDQKDDDVVALYGIMHDTTISTTRELDLVQAKDSVERAYAAKTQFLANMSHELRTPLNAIIGFSEMIERQLLGPIGTEKYLEYIGGIRESGEHLLDLISDILDMSKIEAGKYELNLEHFDLSKIIKMAAHMMEGRALDSNIKITPNLPEEHIFIVADRRAVMQMVLNLLSNAVKFSYKDTNIQLNLAQKKQHVTISVIDEGIGIPANKLANITMPFEQAETDYTREYEGSGLGLAITKELAEIHGGSIDIESQTDIGTTVEIHLPLDAS